MTSSLTLWHLKSESELLYNGDGGSNEPGPATERYGIEWASHWRPTDWLHFDGELSLSHAVFPHEPIDRYVESAIPLTFSAGVTAGKATGPYGTLRARYFSPHPLTEDKSVMSRDSLVFNLRGGYRKEKWDAYVEILNLFDSKANDMEYYFESRLPGEPLAGVSDIHFHPLEPLTIRTGMTIYW